MIGKALFSHFLHMPNWVYNEVEIAAPLSEVQAYLFETADPDCQGQNVYFFNLHRLFPERFEADDQRGLEAWDYDWMRENVGTKWNPKIDYVADDEGGTRLSFDSAWCPPRELLEHLHELTGWRIVNQHDGENPEYDAVFICDGWKCWQELRPGTTVCCNCEARVPSDDIDDEYGECPTCILRRAHYLVSIVVDGAAFIKV